MNIGKIQKIFGIGPVGIAISLAVFGILWLFDSLFVRAEILSQPWPLRIMGGGLIGIWICWHGWTISILRSWLFRDQLCRTGPFRLVQHPMYAGAIFLLSPGIVLLLNSWILLLWPVLIYPIWFVLVRREEKIMANIFGEEYRSYAAGTGRFLPGFFRLHHH
jgi:protein-S-isoprenylcysteine O-methyltransferase Ste14